MDKYKKYYFKVQGYECLEPCPIKESIRIGSVNCQKCNEYIDKNKDSEDRDWIKCKNVSKQQFNLFYFIKKLFNKL